MELILTDVVPLIYEYDHYLAKKFDIIKLLTNCINIRQQLFEYALHNVINSYIRINIFHKMNFVRKEETRKELFDQIKDFGDLKVSERYYKLLGTEISNVMPMFKSIAAFQMEEDEDAKMLAILFDLFINDVTEKTLFIEKFKKDSLEIANLSFNNKAEATQNLKNLILKVNQNEDRILQNILIKKNLK